MVTPVALDGSGWGLNYNYPSATSREHSLVRELLPDASAQPRQRNTARTHPTPTRQEQVESHFLGLVGSVEINSPPFLLHQLDGPNVEPSGIVLCGTPLASAVFL